MTTTVTASLGATHINPDQTTLDVTSNVAFDIFDAGIAGRIAISVAGNIDYVLSLSTITGAGQYVNKIIELTGVLTGSINLIVPPVSKPYVVYNNTTGAFTIKVKTPSGAGIIVSQTQKALLYCDGTNVVQVDPGIGYPQTSESANYTTVLSDAGKHIYHPSADTTARTFTIDSNANVPYAIGTEIKFVNDSSAGAVTIAITSDTLVLIGTGSTGSRTLAANGVATALKVTATRWVISGTNIT